MNAFTLTDLPAPKRPANGTAAPTAAAPAAAAPGRASEELSLDAELPALFGDLGLGDELEAAGPSTSADGARAVLSRAPAILTLDLRDLPAPVGPRPKSRLSTPVATDEPPTRSRRVSSPLLPKEPAASWMAAPRGSQPSDGEPPPLPAPPARDPLLSLAITQPPAAAIASLGSGAMDRAGERKDLARTEPPASRPAILDVQPPPAERLAAPGALLAPQREVPPRPTDPLPRRASQPALPMVPAPAPPPETAAAVTPAVDGKKGEVSLPPLPSDESGGVRPASASVSDPSGLSVITGSQQASSRGTPEARPVRLGYLIAGLAVLAVLLAFAIARIAGSWHKPPALPPASSVPR